MAKINVSAWPNSSVKRFAIELNVESLLSASKAVKWNVVQVFHTWDD